MFILESLQSNNLIPSRDPIASRNNISIGDYLTTDEISSIYSVDAMRGIRYSSTYNMITLITDTTGAIKDNVYLDIFDSTDDIDEFTLYYVGEGKVGDQLLTRGNLRLKNSSDDNTQICVYEYTGAKRYLYTGIFELVDIFKTKQHDENNNLRNVFIFKLKPVL